MASNSPHIMAQNFPHEYRNIVSAGNWTNFAIGVLRCSSLGSLVDRHKKSVLFIYSYIWCFQPIPKQSKSTWIWYQHPISRGAKSNIFETTKQLFSIRFSIPPWSSPTNRNSRPNQDAESGTKPLLKLCLSAPVRRNSSFTRSSAELRWAVGWVLGNWFWFIYFI